MKIPTLFAAALGLVSFNADAAEISTHVLDLTRGVGGRNVPVVLFQRATDGSWAELSKSHTDENGRVRSFGNAKSYPVGTYKLQFDMSSYRSAEAQPFFPEIDLVFQVADEAAHYHVPVVVSPFGYSTYRGN